MINRFDEAGLFLYLSASPLYLVRGIQKVHQAASRKSSFFPRSLFSHLVGRLIFGGVGRSSSLRKGAVAQLGLEVSRGHAATSA
jgi:hypothetical protein